VPSPRHPSAIILPVTDATEVPTVKLDTTEIAALLAARTGDPDPAVPAATPAADAVVDDVPPAGAPSTMAPVPPVGAASVGDVEPFASAPDDAPEGTDGLSLLFGDAGITVDETEPEPEPEPQPEPEPEPEPQPQPEPEPRPEPEPEGLAATATIPFADLAELEPSAAVEGPQFTAPLTVPHETLPAPVFAADPTVVIPAAATPPTPPAPPLPPETRTVGAPSVGAPSVDAPSTEAPGGGSGTGGPPPSRRRDPRNTRLIFIVAGALAVILVLIGLFAIGTRLPSLFGAAAPTTKSTAAASSSATPTPTPTPTPTVTPKPAGPAAAGVQAWDALGGGECIEPYTTPWAESFTVVDCATPHTAQMVYTALISADIAAAYPGTDALSQQINAWCTAPGVVDLTAAAGYAGLQVQGTFPATEEQWKSGQRAYYCFASRSSGEPMTSSVAGPGPTG
jgi:hypothetical protein